MSRQRPFSFLIALIMGSSVAIASAAQTAPEAQSSSVLAANTRATDGGVPSGIYYLPSAINDGICVDERSQDNETIQQYFCNSSRFQMFRFTAGSDNSYTIQALGDQGAVRVLRDTPNHGEYQPVVAEPPAGLPYEKWYVEPFGDGTYKLRNTNDRCLDRSISSGTPGAAIVLHRCGSSIYQHWVLQLVTRADIEGEITKSKENIEILKRIAQYLDDKANVLSNKTGSSPR